MGEQGEGQEDEEGLVRLEVFGNAGASRIGEDIEAGDEEKSGSEVDGEGNGDVARDIGPATDPRGDTAAPHGRQYEGLIVDTAGGWEDRGDLGQREGDTEDHARDHDPAPDDIGRPSAGQRVEQGGGQAIRHGRQDETHKGHLPDGPVARQLGRVAHVF